ILRGYQHSSALIGGKQTSRFKVQFTSRTLFLLFVGVAVVLAPLSWFKEESRWVTAVGACFMAAWVYSLAVANMVEGAEELRESRFARGFELGAELPIVCGALIIALVEVLAAYAVIMNPAEWEPASHPWAATMRAVGAVTVVGLLCGLTAGLVALTLRVVEAPVDDDSPSYRVVETPPNEDTPD
ncbi:MAG: hypothetical protein N2C14_17365, partial [Planctomycetales bacterium]